MLIPDKLVAFFVLFGIFIGCVVLANIGIYIYRLKVPYIKAKKPIKLIKLTREEQIKDDKDCIVMLLKLTVITVVVLVIDFIRRPDVWIYMWNVITKEGYFQ